MFRHAANSHTHNTNIVILALLILLSYQQQQFEISQFRAVNLFQSAWGQFHIYELEKQLGQRQQQQPKR